MASTQSRSSKRNSVVEQQAQLAEPRPKRMSLTKRHQIICIFRHGEAISPRGDMPKNRVRFYTKDASCLPIPHSPIPRAHHPAVLGVGETSLPRAGSGRACRYLRSLSSVKIVKRRRERANQLHWGPIK